MHKANGNTVWPLGHLGPDSATSYTPADPCTQIPKHFKDATCMHRCLPTNSQLQDYGFILCPATEIQLPYGKIMSQA